MDYVFAGQFNRKLHELIVLLGRLLVHIWLVIDISPKLINCHLSPCL